MSISNERRKELQQKYQAMKSGIGIIAVINKNQERYFLQTSTNLQGKINSIRFQLKSGGHPHKTLQRDWNIDGAEQFGIMVLEQIEYKEEETELDHKDDLLLLKQIWQEKLIAENKLLY